jgi:hypothetical protein
MCKSSLRLWLVVLLLAACTHKPISALKGSGGSGSGGSGGGSTGGGSGGSTAGGSGGDGGDAAGGTDGSGSNDAYSALTILQVQATRGGDCTVPAAPTSLIRSLGTLDLGLPDGSAPAYSLPVVVANNLASVDASTATGTNNVTLTHFTVELSAPNVVWSDACPATFDTVAFTYVLAPGATTGVSFDVLTSSHSRCILPYVPAGHLMVTVTVRAKGRKGGTNIESAPFVFPIEVCTGCLQQSYSDPALIAYSYPANYPLCATLVGSNPYTGDPCVSPGQDAKILCCGVTTTVGDGTKNVAVCPGVFTGTASADAATR